MKKIIPVAIALMAIFYSASAQTATTDSAYAKLVPGIEIPEKMIDLSDDSNDKFGIILIYNREKEVKIFYAPKDGQKIIKGSRDEKELVSLMLKAYWNNISKRKVKIVKKTYANKEFKCLILRKDDL